MSIYSLLHVFYELLERVWLARRQTAILCSPACDSLGQSKQPVWGGGKGDCSSLGERSLFR